MAAAGIPRGTTLDAWLLGALLAAQLAVLALRSASAFGLVTGAWALDTLAWLPRGVALTLAVLPCAALLAFAWADWIRRRPTAEPPAGVAVARLAWVPLALVGVACLALPDRSAFLGDFALRRGAIETGAYLGMFPQSLPLDRLFQGVWTPALAHVLSNVSLATRLAGIAAYAAFAFAAWRAGRALGGGFGAAVALLLAAGGTVALFTGFPRDTVQLLPIALGLSVALANRVRDPARPSPIPELLLLAALALHRSAVCLLPAYAVATAHALRSGDGSLVRSRAWRAAVLLLAFGAAVLAPRIVEIVRSFDAVRHFAWLSAATPGAPPGFDPAHRAQVANALLLLAPAAALVTLVASPFARRPGERAFDAACVLGWLPIVFLLRPQQGVFRDVDVYAPMAVVFAFVGARQVAAAAAARVPAARLLLACALVSTLQGTASLLFVASSARAMESRVAAGLSLLPEAERLTRAQMLDYLTEVARARGDRGLARERGRAAAEIAPTPVRLVRAGLDAARDGDPRSARRWFERLREQSPTSVLAWCGIAATSHALGDTAAASRATEGLRRIAADPQARATALRFLEAAPYVDPGHSLAWLAAAP